MVRIERILIPTDGSEFSEMSARYGLMLAKELGAVVHAVHVFDMNTLVTTRYPETEEYIRKTCETYVNRVVEMGKEAGVEVGPLMYTGDPAKILVDLSNDYDLVVMGTVGRTGLSHMIIGSVAEKVVRLSKAPVLVYKDKTKAEKSKH
ncbi:MAG: universal stress protein [Euryarchaeota archaeon]|jgi:nucleotide-binding universal stress UspA family protein|nr:universal stress protein [Euryarchaeota archaeon]